MAVLEYEFRLLCYSILNNNLWNRITCPIYEINSYTITETNSLILFLGTIPLFPWNRVEQTCGQIGQNSVNLIFKQVLHRVTTLL
jgi:hypothetical protein